MTYVPDGEPFALSYGEPPAAGSLAAGWLARDRPMRRGSVPEAFVDRLREMCRHGVNRTRGLHRCELCRPEDSVVTRPPAPTWVACGDGGFIVGHAEIHVKGSDGTNWVAPDMIIHYVEHHGYRPPDGFVEAVTAGPHGRRDR